MYTQTSSSDPGHFKYETNNKLFLWIENMTNKNKIYVNYSVSYTNVQKSPTVSKAHTFKKY